MAKAKGTKSVTFSVGGADDDDKNKDELTEDGDEISALRELEGFDESTFQIFRVTPPDQKGFITTLSAGEVTIEEIARQFGPGKYRVRGKRSDGTWLAHKTITIATAKRDAPTATASPQGGGTAADVLAILRDDRDRASERLFKWAGLFVPVLAPVVLEWFKSNKGSLREMAETLKAMREAAGGDKDALSEIEKLGKLITAVRDMQPEGGGTGSTWPDLIRSGIDGLKEIVPAVVAARASPAFVPVAPAAPPGRTTVPQPPAPPPLAPPPHLSQPQPGNEAMAGIMALAQWLIGQMPYLIEKARRDQDPELYADWIAGEVPPGMNIRTMHDLLARPDWFKFLTQYAPGAQHFEAWFTELRARLLETLAEVIAEQDAREGNKPEAPAAGTGDEALGVESQQ